MQQFALTAKDFYKTDHISQYPENTEYVYSNLTPRSGKHSNTELGGIIFFGLQGFIVDFLLKTWQETFFDVPKERAVARYKRRLDTSLGKDAVSIKHIEELHDLGYLPLCIKALPEGSFVPYGVPALTIVNTDKRFCWLTNDMETALSAEIWLPCTSATTAFAYKKKFLEYAEKTGYDQEFVSWQGHDFSLRGMTLDSGAKSGAGHLTSFTGTDTIPAIDYLEAYYGANSEKEMIGGSVPASEHSVMCIGNKDGEFETFKRFITEIYPTGIVSIVSDTWDFWKVMTEYMPQLKDIIEAREGRVVIRPDSGDPADIICGTSNDQTPEGKGAYEILWDIFGGTINAKGYKTLNPKVGLIYGDSITLERQNDILERLEKKGFCASNLVLGIGSYTYQYVTRDTHGFAVKATWCMVNGVGQDIFKDPKTDSGIKKSAKGLLCVIKENGKYKLIDSVNPKVETSGCLEKVFVDGRLVKFQTLSDIRTRVKENI